mgnify:CR=1 FL=1
MTIGGVSIPTELTEQGRALRSRCVKRMVVSVAVLYLVLGAGVVFLSPWQNPLARSVQGALITTLTISLLFRLRNQSRLEALKFLRLHDFCSCGYKSVSAPGGGMRQCPECGRAWWRPKKGGSVQGLAP